MSCSEQTGYLNIDNAHLRVEGNIVAENIELGNIQIGPTYGLSSVTDVGNTTSQTVQFTNAATGLVTTGNVTVGKELTVTGNVTMSEELAVTGNVTMSEELTVTGNVEVSGTIHGYTKVSASGGTESTTNAPGHKTHTFTSDGTFTVTTPGLVEYLVVAGGGGAPGRDVGGGGGGGGVKTGTLLIPTGTYTITVGAGGQGKYDNGSGVENLSGMKGGNSSIGTFVESIGGGGGRDFNTDLPNNDYEGGSGGGGAGITYLTPGLGILPQGNEGGTGLPGTETAYGGGGGGGAGRRGRSAAEGRHGGDGIQSSISGTSTYYGGGGGGAGHRSSGNGTEGNGGLGGGGDCNQSTTTSDRNGTDGLGGGGGASRNTTLTGGSGGSGIVIIRYLL